LPSPRLLEDRPQFRLEGVREQLVAHPAQEGEQLGPPNPPDDRFFRFRQRNRRTPVIRTHVSSSLFGDHAIRIAKGDHTGNSATTPRPPTPDHLSSRINGPAF